MYRRLIIFGLAVCGSALIALLVPLALAARDIVQADQISQAAAKARSVANDWQRQSPQDDKAPPFVPPQQGTPGEVSLYYPNGRVQGPDPQGAARAVDAASRGGAASDIVDGWGYVTAPAYFDEEIAVVLISLTPDELREGLMPRLAALAGVSLVLLGLAGGTAWWLARRTVAPLRDLEETANAVAAGDLTARAPHSSINEIAHVGVALNRLTGRVQELLREEREYTAELAHQLRTPLTVLSVDVDGVSDDEVRDRLRDDVSAVHRMVDEIINTARRAGREGLHARCDAGEVVEERARFWEVLAEDQGRDFEHRIPDAQMPVRLTSDDLAAAIDILFQNVFLHTPEGTAFGVSVTADTGCVDVTVWDHGPGFDVAPTDSEMVGSTRLGLSIAQRLAEASGGTMVVDSSTGGATVRLRLGPPTD